jgi:hypothetical protein
MRIALRRSSQEESSDSHSRRAVADALNDRPLEGRYGPRLRQTPRRHLGDRVSERLPGDKVCPYGQVGPFKSFFVGVAPGRAVLQVGYASYETAVFVAPEYVDLVLVVLYRYHGVSFPTLCEDILHTGMMTDP